MTKVTKGRKHILYCDHVEANFNTSEFSMASWIEVLFMFLKDMKGLMGGS